jgi:pyruvate dehydrogenase E2 component (dihydrolipoamide acetyltransferase)
MPEVREFTLPDIGEGLTEAEIIRWTVAPGDRVHDGMVVCEIETAKAAVELPIPFDGVVRELHAEPGATVPVGTVIVSVDAEAAARQPVLVGYGAAAGSERRRPRTDRPVATAAVSSLPQAKPPVRKLAKELGVDLAAVQPTGADGIITRDDVQAAAAPPPDPAPRQGRIPVRGVRRATARAMVDSAFTAPHVTEFVTVDLTRTMRLVDRLKRDNDFAGVRVTPLLLVLKAFLVASRRNPEINASWDEAAQEIVLHERVNLGVAAATPRGLIVPNIKDAQSLPLPRLAAALAQLVTSAREGATQPADLTGGTITVTNIGVFGVDTGTPILNPGEAAILAVGAIGPRPWVHRGAVVPRQVGTLALSFDHRLVDGELGSRVLADTAAVLSRPRRLITWT